MFVLFVYSVHIKKSMVFPSPAGMSLTKLFCLWVGIITLFPARESLVSDIPAGDGKTANLFLQCNNCKIFSTFLWNNIFQNEGFITGSPLIP